MFTSRKGSAGFNLTDTGRFLQRTPPPLGEATPTSVFGGRLRGHTESLRRKCGDAAGTELGTSLVNRRVVNVGSVMVLPDPPPSWGGGKARRQLMAPWRGGVLVVVRGRESRLHGEGGQPDSNSRPAWQKSTVNTDDPPRASARGGYCGTGCSSTVKMRGLVESRMR